MKTVPTTTTLFQRLAQLRHSINAIQSEIRELTQQVPPVDDGNGIDVGAELRLQLHHAAQSLDEAADMLGPLPEHEEQPALAQAVVQEFRCHHRSEFNAALATAARDPDMHLTVATDASGDTVAIIHRGPMHSPAGRQ